MGVLRVYQPGGGQQNDRCEWHTWRKPGKGMQRRQRDRLCIEQRPAWNGKGEFISFSIGEAQGATGWRNSGPGLVSGILRCGEIETRPCQSGNGDRSSGQRKSGGVLPQRRY